MHSIRQSDATEVRAWPERSPSSPAPHSLGEDAGPTGNATAEEEEDEDEEEETDSDEEEADEDDGAVQDLLP